VTSGGRIWVANEADDTVTSIDAAARRATRTVPVASPPQSLAAWRGGLYVSVRAGNRAHRGGTLRVAQQAPDFVDPALAYSSEAWAILAMTNDGLVGFRRVGGIEGVQLVPDLAIALPRPTDGGRSYTFRLRSGVRYSTGGFVRAADFRRAIERSFEIRPDQPGRHYFGGILGAASCRRGPCDLSRGIVTDERARTVTFRLTAPDAGFLTKLALSPAFAVPSTTPGAAMEARPVPATGPYRIAAYRKGRTMTLVRNRWFREWSADAQPDGYPDTIRLTFDPPAGPNATPRTVLDGDADVVSLGAQTDARGLRAVALRHPSQLHLSPVSATTFFAFDTHSAPFDDVRVRRAVEYLFDQRALARRNGPGFAATCQIVPPRFPGYRQTCPYASGGRADIRAARRVARSGAGRPVSVWVPGERHADGQYMVGVLNVLGFPTRLRLFRDIGAYFTAVNPPGGHAPQVAWNAWAADYPSQAGFLMPVFDCAENAFILNRFCDRQVNRLLAAASRADAQNPAAAPARWQRAERAILARAAVVPMYNLQFATFVSKQVGNVEQHPQWGVLLDRLWVR
jgi:peptide/nickel transport system substrate-binding protein